MTAGASRRHYTYLLWATLDPTMWSTLSRYLILIPPPSFPASTSRQAQATLVSQLPLSMARSTSQLRTALMLALCFLLLPAALPGSAGVVVTASEDELEQTVTKRGFADDEVRVLFCTSCGFKQNFVEVKKYLEDKYPHLVDRVYGANYDVDPIKKMLAQLLGYVQLASMVLMVFGEQIFRVLAWDDTLLQKALDNRIGCFAVILLMGSVSQGLVSTGAFEVYYNDDLVFSKLQAGRWPTLDEISQLLEAKGLNAIY